jgi:hypothetical protein
MKRCAAATGVAKRERQLCPESRGVAKRPRRPRRKLLYGEAELAFKADWTWGHKEAFSVDTVLYIQHASREAADKIIRWVWTYRERCGDFPGEFHAMLQKALHGRILAYDGATKNGGPMETQLLGVAKFNVRSCASTTVAHGKKGEIEKIVAHIPYDPVACAEVYSAAEVDVL